MLSLLFGRRRPAARRPYVRRLALEQLEGRDAPSSLDPTSSLTSPDVLSSSDPVPAVPAAINTTSGSTSGTATPAPLPQPVPQPGSLLAVAAPPRVATTTATTSGAGGTSATSSTLASTATGLPAIDDVEAATNEDLTCTVSGHVTDSNPASLTVHFSGWVMDGLKAPVKSDGSFTITVEIPVCTSATTASHTCTAVATSAAGPGSAPVSFVIMQTPQPAQS
jgi:hypothetical protein